MKIGFDASRAFVSEATGTENYSLNLLKALAKVDRKNRYRVYLRDKSKVISLSRRERDSKSKLWKFSTRSNNILRFDTGILRASDPPAGGESRSFHFPSNFEFRPIGPSRLWTQLGLALETWRAPVDLLFVPAHTLPILRKRRKTKYVVTIHDLGVEYLPGYHQFPQRYYLDFASRYAARHADGIIAVSTATKIDLVKRYHTPSKKIFVVHEGVNTRFFTAQPKSKIERVKKRYKIIGPYILYVGTIQPRKNLLMLIRAFADLVKSQSQKSKVEKNLLYTPDFDCELVIAGKLGWDWDEIFSSVKRLGIEKLVKFIGRVPDSDLPALYTGAVVFAFPSLFEGFGLPILEALACGCPVVASDIAPHREIFEKISNQSGKRPFFFGKAEWKVNPVFLTKKDFDSNFVPMILAKPNNVRQWVDVLYQYISQYKKRSTFITAKNLRLDAFSWEKAAIGTLQVFDKILS